MQFQHLWKQARDLESKASLNHADVAVKNKHTQNKHMTILSAHIVLYNNGLKPSPFMFPVLLKHSNNIQNRLFGFYF